MAASMQALRRRRQPQENIDKSNYASRHLTEESFASPFGYYESFFVWLLIFGLYLGVLFTIGSRFHLFPKPRTADNRPVGGVFYESLARRHLETVTSFGQRPAGSEANELHAKNYIAKELLTFKEHLHESKEMLIDVQNTSGSFHLYFIHTDFYSVYKNLKNVVVKLGPASGATHSVLMNCHYDTMIDAIGAGDDMSSCAVMLEIARSLSQSNKPLMHNIIFLFNGAEENLLQGSHGFITQHPWAKSIKAFINLDSAGAGGWEIVFQTGPQHPWLVKVYIESAVYPSASVINQEIFELGLVPADTDYRIFRDYGKIPGLDIAYISNGYVYHTVNDVPATIPPGCLQRAGENLLSIVQALATNPKLADPGDDRHGSMVFYDVVGLVVVRYPKRIGSILNCIVSCCAFILLWKKAGRVSTGMQNTKVENGFIENDAHYRKANRTAEASQAPVMTAMSGYAHLKNMLAACVATTATWIVCILVVSVGVALPLSLCGRSLFWYTNTYTIWPLFVLPGSISIISMQQFLKPRLFKGLHPVYVEQIFFDTVLCELAVANLILTYLGLGMSYLVMLWVLLPLVFRECVTQVAIIHWQDNKKLMLMLHLGGILVPLLSSLYIIYMFLLIIIPTMGRVGTTVHPDLALASLVTLFVLSCCQYLFGLVYLCDMRPVTRTLAAVFIIGLLAVLFTPLGFPFSGDKDSPTPQRFSHVHINRENYNLKGDMVHSDSGLWYLPQDYLKDQLHKDHFSVYKTATTELRGAGPYYGLPYFIPILHLLNPRDSKYMPTPAISPEPKVEPSLISRHSVSPDVLRLTFQVKGPDHMTVYISPQPAMTLVGWSILPGTPLPVYTFPDMNETSYFIYYGHGETPQEPWQFHFDIQATTGHWPGDQHIVDIAFSGYYVHGKHKSTPELDELHQNLLPWMVPISFSATYASYQF
ncbi:endoplasmic reticulum metallopeptidase 1-like [Ylistrum balloti]|uniref:endoplasmic reticulum metallopeptidase 1-like n=1 Tax=Ylistrum balloti TaxID=509963 RepID=UPI002905F5CC|nr:endoplasmic reticulum metallopeptidase 1-like [Ylistrum balloti]